LQIFENWLKCEAISKKNVKNSQSKIVNVAAMHRFSSLAQEFQCDAFVTTVQLFKKLIERENGLAHFCDFRWYTKHNGFFKHYTLERMGSDADYVCATVASSGSCPRSARNYCRVQAPCTPNCGKCRGKLNNAISYVNYATGQLTTCHVPILNVLETQTGPTEVVTLSHTRESTTIDRTRTSLNKVDYLTSVWGRIGR
jgi:hypothetical protein